MSDASHLARLAPRQTGDPALRQFLFAQLEWERYRALRLLLVHAAAGGAVCLWLLLALDVRLPDLLRLAVLAAWALCFLGAAFAGMMEYRWFRRRCQLTAMLGLEEEEREPRRERTAGGHARGDAPRDARAHRR
jgi:hypothetical protein